MFEMLENELDAALKRASGYGQKQHGNGKTFENQPICEANRLFGKSAIGPSLFQIWKKSMEIPKYEKDRPEKVAKWLDDIIVYACAAKIVFGETAINSDEIDPELTDLIHRPE